jgi:hypothetical protein
MGRGDVGPLLKRLEGQISRAQAHAGGERDVGIIAGSVLTMLGIRALKILPSIPFAPGHKLVLLTPLYILAAAMTKTRLGGTLTGLVMGSVAFLLGDGRYGVFEILKHLTPGLLCDLFVPFLINRQLGGFGWSAFGAFIAAGRFVTILCVVAFVQAPRIAYAMLGPGLLIHCTFGAASGYITYHLIRSAKETWVNFSPGTGAPTSNPSSCANLSSTET